MATLTTDDYAWMVNWIRNHPTYKITLKQSGFSRGQLQSRVQAIETYMTNCYNNTPLNSLRTAINTATGATPTLAQNQAMRYAWGAWRAH